MNHYRISLSLLFGMFAQCMSANESAATVPEYDAEILGGSPVQKPIPWYAAFIDNTRCGGVLVHEDILVTTGACVVDGNAPKQVRIGSLDLFTGGTVVDVQEIKIHPDFVRRDVIYGGDIAVIKLANSISSELAVLNTVQHLPVDDAKLFVMGFGLLGDGSLPNQLYGLFYDYVELCQNRFSLYNASVHLCADATPQQGACAGDGGSPAVLSGTKTVVGLASFGDALCGGTYDAYTRISTYNAWVQERICALSSHKPSSCSTGFLGSGCGVFGWTGIQRAQQFFGF